MSSVIIPGSFDPVTNGHMDIIKKASKIFDRVIVAVCDNKDKTYMFTKKRRYEFLKTSVSGLENIEIIVIDGLLSDYMKKENISIIVKGIRNAFDFEYEVQMSNINKKLFNEAETIFLMANNENRYISSSAVKQIVSLGGNVSGFVPDCILHQIKS